MVGQGSVMLTARYERKYYLLVRDKYWQYLFRWYVCICIYIYFLFLYYYHYIIIIAIVILL